MSQEHLNQEHLNQEELQQEADVKATEEVAEESAEEIVEEADAETCENEECDLEEAGNEEAGNEEASSDAAPKKGIFKKKKKDPRDVQIEELTDRVKRQMAEFENFRKRTEREKSQMYEVGAKDIITKMLPVVDNFERGLQSISEEDLASPVGEGMNMIYKQILSVFEMIDVKPIEAVGQEFNPDFHSAVMHVEDEEAGDNVVVEEFQKGYTYRDSVIRYSMVKVAN